MINLLPSQEERFCHNRAALLEMNAVSEVTRMWSDAWNYRVGFDSCAASATVFVVTWTRPVSDGNGFVDIIPCLNEDIACNDSKS